MKPRLFARKADPAPPAPGGRHPAAEVYWRSLSLLNTFRLLSVVALLLSGSWFMPQTLDGEARWRVFLWLSSSYTLLALVFLFGIRLRRPVFEMQLTLHAVTDIAFIVALVHLFGGVRSGLGILLLCYLAAAGLIARGRMTLFHAAIASIALLTEHTVRRLSGDPAAGDYANVVLLCLASFAVAWLAHRLARYARESEALAQQRGVDLEQMGQLNARILQDVSEGVLVVNVLGQVRQYNEQAGRLIGERPDCPIALSAFLPELEQVLACWREDPYGTPALVQAGATRKTLRPRFAPASFTVTGDVLVYLEDMDRLRREAQQLKLAALGRLTANLAHEIRNPLGAISHAAQLLAEEADDDPLKARLTRIIGENTGRLERMVADVLELNRRDRLERALIPLHGWLASFLDDVRQVENISIRIDCVCPAEAQIRFDPGHLHQVLWNLVRNGWRYCTKQPGSLRLMVEMDDDGHWRLDVLNDGPPVPVDAQSQLFEPFFTTESKGTGLGLYIAREICAANSAWLEYIPARHGACFRIVFEVDNGEKG
ncbi:ATP-binding protein [Chitiniphilus purpureus]|uniref:histidine kinase n=1 Tax=Chitiniphilus purpureus TaxID=2981137 RepID=A0ABY6DQA4_9NEIS|nr:ATP-binding protein [Chitiniphilus sp. CD1]UXY16217.1 ATP-binding protein [Chitiniphilus sp. CD1]